MFCIGYVIICQSNFSMHCGQKPRDEKSTCSYVFLFPTITEAIEEVKRIEGRPPYCLSQHAIIGVNSKEK